MSPARERLEPRAPVARRYRPVTVCQASDALRAVPPTRPVDARLAGGAPPPSRATPRRRRPPAGAARHRRRRPTRRRPASGYANAVVVGDAAYLVDCGEGAHSQLWRAGLDAEPELRPRPPARAVGVRHPPPRRPHHGPGQPLPRELAAARRRRVRPGAGRPADRRRSRPTPSGRSCSPTTRRRACGPPTEHLLRAFAYNINLRIADEGRIDVTEVGPGARDRACGGTGYAPDIDLGVRRRRQLGGRRRAADGPGRDLPRGRPRRAGDRGARAARAGVPGLRLPLRHAARARWCSRATPARATTSCASPPGPTCSCTR